MVAALFAILLAAPFHASGAARLPAVSEIPFDDLVRFSDLIVVGTVERVQTIEWLGWKLVEAGDGQFYAPPLPHSVPFAEVVVSRVLKGDARTERLVFLAAGTWTCDITTAKVGERALLFLARVENDELFDDQLRRDMKARFAEVPVLRVLWSGRGKMPLRSLPDGDYATYWDEVVMRQGFPSVAGPEPEHRFIHSAPLTAFAEEIATCVSAQVKPWLRASVTEVRDGGHAWDLEVARNRQSRLVVHEPAGDREVHFLLESSRAVRVDSYLDRARYVGYPDVLGSGHPSRGTRTLTVLDSEDPTSVRILVPDEGCMNGSTGDGARSLLDVWQALRGAFVEELCADHRPDDLPFLER